MSTDTRTDADADGGIDLDAAVATLYREPPEAFVAGRDALARALRGAKRRDEAATVAKLRRPSRVAWAFNAALAGDEDLGSRLDDAVSSVTAAQDGAGSVRSANAELRSVVDDLVDAAARTAAGAGHDLDRSTMTPSALAVVGDPDALAALQAGRLGDVPSGGGFGFGLELAPEPAARAEPAKRAAPAKRPTRATRAPTTRAARSQGTKPASDAAAARRAEAQAAAERSARRAEAEEAAADEAVEDAEQALAGARGFVEGAEGDRAQAEAALAEAQERLAAAKRDIVEANRAHREAERALSKAQARRRVAAEAAAAARAALGDAEPGG